MPRRRLQQRVDEIAPPTPKPEPTPLDAPPTVDEVQQAFILRLRIRGANKTQIYAACREEFRIGWQRVERLLKQGLDDLQAAHQARAPYTKAEQAERLRATIVQISEPRVKTRIVGKGKSAKVVEEKLQPNYQALMRAEELLADVEGNREPLRVDVQHTHTVALVGVVAAMKPERKQELLDRARERKRLLVEAGTRVPLLPPGESQKH